MQSNPRPFNPSDRRPLLDRLHDAYTLNVDATTRENLCSEAHGIITQLVGALEGVIAVADRNTDEFARTRAILAKIKGEHCG